MEESKKQQETLIENSATPPTNWPSIQKQYEAGTITFVHTADFEYLNALPAKMEQQQKDLAIITNFVGCIVIYFSPLLSRNELLQMNSITGKYLTMIPKKDTPTEWFKSVAKHTAQDIKELAKDYVPYSSVRMALNTALGFLDSNPDKIGVVKDLRLGWDLIKPLVSKENSGLTLLSQVDYVELEKAARRNGLDLRAVIGRVASIIKQFNTE